MGYATTRAAERVAASIGALVSAPIQFQNSCDVPKGGVLLALPALLAARLLRHTAALYELPNGFYGIASIFLLLALMGLARIKSIEQLRYVAPGEWGNLLGLDRIPEVRTLRQKLEILCRQAGRAMRWNTALAKEWIAGQRESEMVFCVDGHVRVYSGDLTPLPRHYVARERLCLRGTTDYWINALDGQPFLLVNKEVDPGLLATLRADLVPWLKTNVPASEQLRERLEADSLQHWFTLVFDREAYSPEFFAEMKKQHIAVLTYHKFPGEKWSEEEFGDCRVALAGGEMVTMKLAERGTLLSNRLWVREVRKLGESGHQTSILSTNYQAGYTVLAASLFARWSQENFFKYMRQHYIAWTVWPSMEPNRFLTPSRPSIQLGANSIPRSVRRTKKGGGNWPSLALSIYSPYWRIPTCPVTRSRRRSYKSKSKTSTAISSNSNYSANRRRITSPSRTCPSLSASAACSPNASISSIPSSSSLTARRPAWRRYCATSSTALTMPVLYSATSTTPKSTSFRICRPRLSPCACIISLSQRMTTPFAISVISSMPPRPSFPIPTSSLSTSWGHLKFHRDQEF